MTIAVLVLITIIFVLAIIQPTKNRKLAASCLSFPTAIHCLFFTTTDGYTYYHYAALSDALIIILLAKLVNFDDFVKRLLIASCAFFAVHVVGYALFMSYAPPLTYNVLSLGVYLYIIAILLKRETANGRDIDLVNGNSWIRSYWLANIFQHKSGVKE